MGYRVYYNLDICRLGDDGEPKPLEFINETDLFHEIINDLRSTIEFAEFAFDEDGRSTGDIKWTNDEDDMKGFSKKYPDLIFLMSCEGSDGEKWEDYYMNGKMQYCAGHVVYDPFDLNQLT
jgi:hypothetical protein